MDFKEEITQKFNQYQIPITELQIERFNQYYQYLLEWNSKINLTAITEQSEVITKHFIDCILPLSHFPQNASVIDIGSGAGFPAIPLMIMRPDLKITMVDSLNKRVNFLNGVIELLHLSNISALHVRCEDLANNPLFRENFDVSTARAVAKINILAEYCTPFLKIGGLFIAYKSIDIEEELNASKNAFQKLFLKLLSIENYKLEDSTRMVAIIEKLDHTLKQYPRPQNKPRNFPL